MRQKIMIAARQIASEVRASENSCDVALADNARLLAALLDARREAGVPAKTGQQALGRALDALNHVAKAREMLLESHAELARLNLRELAVGDMSECPELMPSGQMTLVSQTNSKAA